MVSPHGLEPWTSSLKSSANMPRLQKILHKIEPHDSGAHMAQIRALFCIPVPIFTKAAREFIKAAICNSFAHTLHEVLIIGNIMPA